MNTDRAYTTNGLNQYSAAGAASFTYDANGNLTSDGTASYLYDVENRMVQKTGGGANAYLRYDPLGRLYELNGTSEGLVRFLHDGDTIVAEYNSAGTMLRRYAHGTGAGDDPLVWWEGAGVATAAKRYLFADERGSIVAVTDQYGTVANRAAKRLRSGASVVSSCDQLSGGFLLARGGLDSFHVRLPTAAAASLP